MGAEVLLVAAGPPGWVVLGALAVGAGAIMATQNSEAIGEALDNAASKAKSLLRDITASEPCKECDDCTKKNAEISAVRNELKQRYDEMRRDERDLFNTRPTGTMSWQGHIMQFRSKQAQLRSLLSSLPPNCPPPPDAWEWASKDPPSKPAPKWF